MPDPTAPPPRVLPAELIEAECWRNIAVRCEEEEATGECHGLCQQLDTQGIESATLYWRMRDRLRQFHPWQDNMVFWWSPRNQGARILAACLLAVWADEGEAI